jgi:hypothetical protein
MPAAVPRLTVTWPLVSGSAAVLPTGSVAAGRVTAAVVAAGV